MVLSPPLLNIVRIDLFADVTVAKDGQEAYNFVKSSMDQGKPYNLIFMDVQVCPGHIAQLKTWLMPC